jgi:hypothetical protein
MRALTNPFQLGFVKPSGPPTPQRQVSDDVQLVMVVGPTYNSPVIVPMSLAADGTLPIYGPIPLSKLDQLIANTSAIYGAVAESLVTDTLYHAVGCDPGAGESLHTDLNTTIHGDLGTVITGLGTLHADLHTTLHNDLGVLVTAIGVIHTDLGPIDASLGTIHGDLGTIHDDVNTVRTDLVDVNTALGATGTLAGLLQDLLDILTDVYDATGHCLKVDQVP